VDDESGEFLAKAELASIGRSESKIGEIGTRLSERSRDVM